MARYKPCNYAQRKFIPVAFEEQILPGTFAYTLNYLIDNELSPRAFDRRYRNDTTGASAYNPRVLLKIILHAYSRGVADAKRLTRMIRNVKRS
jgi:transposase